MEYTNILMEKSGALAQVTINRPKVLNALNRKTLEELDHAFSQIESDPAIKAVIVTGAGDKSFIAGADINEFNSCDAAEGARFAKRGQAVLNRIENLDKPVIAAINGFALGGGCELAMACHIRIASSKARLGQPEINLGIIPGFGGTQRLTRLIGEGRAMELVLSGDPISAEEAKQMGLVNRVVAPEELLAAAKSLASKIAGKGAMAVRYAMESVHHGLQVSLPEALNLEAKLFGLCCATEDKREGTTAFLEKRTPSFKDR
jgi:enoyl-CoA hydratase